MPLDPLKLANEALKKALENEKRNRSLLASIGASVIDILKPILDRMSSDYKQANEELKDEISKIKIEVNPEFKLPDIVIPEIKVPDVKMPEIKIPQVNVSVPKIEIPQIKLPRIEVPKAEVKVNIPPIKIPDIIMPKEMEVKGWVGLMGISLDNPLPVQLRDKDGKPVNLFENLTTVIGSSGGGGFKVNKIGDIANSAWGALLNADGRLRVENTSASGLTDTELRASSVPVEQVSGSTWSVSVNDAFRTTVASNLINSDDRLRVSLETGSSGLTDTELRATAVPVSQLSGATWSVSVNDAFRTTVASSLINSDDRLRVSLETGGSGLTDVELRASAVPVSQLSGASWTVNVVDVFATTAASTVVNPDNRVKTELVGTLTVDGSGVTQPVSATDLDIRDLVNATDSVRAYQLSGASWSVEASATDLDIRDLTNATDSVRVYQLSGASWSVTANANSGVDIGDVDVISVVPGTAASNLGKAEDAAHASGDTGILALSVRNSLNTTFAVDGDYQPIATDGIGRVITRPVQVRGLLQTAYVSLTTGTETTLLAGVAGIYFDLIYVMGTNNSDAAVTVDLRSATGGGIITSIRVPANGTAGVSLSAPIPQNVAADTWTADLPDITGSTITLGALFSREV